MNRVRNGLLLLVIGWVVGRAWAQIDPVSRQLFQFGLNLPVEGKSPLSAYAFYYDNHPGFIRTNLTLRLAVAPVYLDAELGIRGALGEHTDVGLGVAGGGFADSYFEIRDGRFREGESFTGHAADVSVSVYHPFNPTPGGRTPESLAEVPLQALLRVSPHYSWFIRDKDTASRVLGPRGCRRASESIVDTMAAIHSGWMVLSGGGRRNWICSL